MRREQADANAPTTWVLRQVAVELQHFSHDAHGAVREVQARLLWARAAVEDQASRAAAWCDAAAALAADPRFAGVRLSPQWDLVPLGADPVSGLQEFYHPRSAWSAVAMTRDPETRRLRLREGAGLVFVLLPRQRVLIGHQARDPALPRHDPVAGAYARPEWVELAPFFLSKYEMTQAQWWHLTGEEPSYHRRGQFHGLGPPIDWSHPVEQVSASNCDAVLRAIGLCLPTEAQWEYAAGAGAPTFWFFGDDPRKLIRFGNMQDESYALVNVAVKPVIEGDDGFSATAPIGSLDANPFGLHDVVGNVSEWCRDRWGSYEAWPAAPGDGLRSPLPQDRERSFRGGSFCENPLRRGKTSSRQNIVHDARERFLGLRPARSLSGGP